jgi:hypothetical protein
MLHAESFEGRMIMAVADFCRLSPQAQGGELIEHFKDSEFSAALASSQAALLETRLEADHMEEEFHGVVALWHQSQRKQRLAALSAKPNPTTEEQAEMRDLVAQLSELQGMSGANRKNATI